MKKRSNKFLHINRACIIILCVLLCLLCCTSIVPTRIAAEDNPENKYTGVLEDLQSDETFNAAEYSDIKLHSKTELIQIAESVDQQLFVYLHIVGDDKGFEKIVFNTATSFTSLDFRSYEMALVSSRDGFNKYLVKDFNPPQDNYYRVAITRIEYPVNKPVEGTQQVTYEYYPIEQVWDVRKDNGKIEYNYEYLNTIEVLDKYVGSHSGGVQEGFSWSYQYSSWTDTYYIAFSTDLLMENLLEAQIEYVENIETASGIISGDSTKPHNVVIRSDEVSNYENDTFSTWLGMSWNTGIDKRTFKSISTPAEFTRDTGITLPKRADDTEFDWVVVFLNETQKFDYPGVKINFWRYPADTSILRLKFETDGVCYNLSVLDNRTTFIPPLPEDDTSWVDRLIAFFEKIGKWFEDNWEWIVVGALGVLALILLAPFLPSIVSLIATCFKYLFTGLIWLIGAPIRLIMRLFGGGDE